ncbi:hypothetical protein Pcac1_g20609 [Phytophthora cactorum]|nr:hypothetical protein Pcac1_g20609 [Phytophthora cactorum]
MVKLFCAIVGDAGSAFPVDIDVGQSVGDLKKAIKEEINYPDPVYKLQLFWRRRRTARGCKMTTLVCSSWTKGDPLRRADAD